MSDLEFRLEYVEADLREETDPERSAKLAKIRADLIDQMRRGEGGWEDLPPLTPPAQREGKPSMSIAELAALLRS